MLPSPYDLVPLSALRHRMLKTGETAFRQDDPSRGLYILLQGRVELCRYTESGEKVLIHRANSGETFAEASLFSDKYHCDAVAVLDCHLVEMNREAILQKFKEEPEFALAIAQKFATQTQEYRRKLEILAIKSAPKRILAAMAHGLMKDNVKTFALDIGLTHEVVYRSLKKLVAEGLLDQSARGKYQLKY